MLKMTGRAALAGLTFSAGCQSPTTTKSKPQGFLIGACDWSLGKTADPEALNVASQLGLDGVQISMGTLKDDMHTRKPEVQAAYLQAAQKYNVQIASLALGELNVIPYKSDPRTEKWVSDSIDVCRALNINVVLLAFFSNGDLLNDPKGKAEVVNRLKKVAPKAEDAGVILGIESWLSAEELMDMIDKIGSPNIQVYYDVGNTNKSGYDIYREIRFLNKHICEFHAKDYNGTMGHGSVDFAQVRQAMDDIGYRGWIQWEGVKLPQGRLQTCTTDVQYLRTIFPRQV